MTDAGQMWQEVGQRFADFGSALKARLDESAPAAGDAIDDAVRSFVEAAGKLGAKAVDVGRDPEVRASAQRAGMSLAVALARTFNEAGVTISGWLEQQGFKDAAVEAPEAAGPGEISAQPEPKAIGTTSPASPAPADTAEPPSGPGA